MKKNELSKDELNNVSGGALQENNTEECITCKGCNTSFNKAENSAGDSGCASSESYICPGCKKNVDKDGNVLNAHKKSW